VITDELGVVAVRHDAARAAVLDVLLAGVLGETPLVRLNDELLSRELHLAAAQGLDDGILRGVLGTNRHEHLADAHAGDHADRLTVRSTHTRRETVSAGAGKHLVLTEDVERVSADAHVEVLLAENGGKVLVARNTRRLEGLGRNLLTLVGHKVAAVREGIDRGRLLADLIDADLGVRDTTAKARLDVRLVLAITVTNVCRGSSSTHTHM